MTDTARTLILTRQQLDQKLVRMAHEMHERHFKDKSLYLVGVSGNGTRVAERLAGLLASISELEVFQFELSLDKDDPLNGKVKFSGDLRKLRNKHVVLVDDVLNSGRTLIYASRLLLEVEPKSLSTAVLVDRFHRRFPVRADYVGLTLSTNLKEHVAVDMRKGKESAYLE